MRYLGANLGLGRYYYCCPPFACTVARSSDWSLARAFGALAPSVGGPSLTPARHGTPRVSDLETRTCMRVVARRWCALAVPLQCIRHWPGADFVVSARRRDQRRDDALSGLIVADTLVPCASWCRGH